MTIMGDTFDTVARRVYGPRAETLMSLLIEANLEFKDVVLFSGGQILTVPAKPETSQRIGPPWMQ